MQSLTPEQATQAARDIFLNSYRGVNVHSSVTHDVLRRISTGFHIPTDAYADAEALRTESTLALWLRVHAVDTAAGTIL